jgi:hypothetical protein
VKNVPLSTFMDCGPGDEKSGIYHVGSGLFELRCSAGRVELELGQTAQSLNRVLDVLAAKGVRRLPLEWDGW